METVLLTGAAGVGKSTLAAALSADPRIAVFEYGAELTRQVSRAHPGLTQAELRGRPTALVTSANVLDTDEALQRFVATHTGKKHVVIDSHAITKETYGFRAAPFTPAQLHRAALTRIVVLHCRPSVLVARVDRDPGGRARLDEWEAAQFSDLQSCVALSYAIALGIPVHFIDCEVDPAEVHAAFVAVLTSVPH